MPHLLTCVADTFRCIGGKVEDFPDIETAKKVQVHYTLAAANAFASRLLAKAPAGTFRFVFCSGAHAVRDENAHLWFQQETRRLKVRDEVRPEDETDVE